MNERDEAEQQRDDEQKQKRCEELFQIAWLARSPTGDRNAFTLNDLQDLRYFLGLNKEPS